MNSKLTGPEVALLLRLLRPRVEILAETLCLEVQQLPPGDASWSRTMDQLELAQGAMAKLENMR